MLLYLFNFRKVFFEGASKSLTAFFTVYRLLFECYREVSKTNLNSIHNSHESRIETL